VHELRSGASVVKVATSNGLYDPREADVVQTAKLHSRINKQTTIFAYEKSAGKFPL